MKKLIVALLNLSICFAYYDMQAAAQDDTVIVGGEEFDFTVNNMPVVPISLPEESFEVPCVVSLGNRNYKCSACTYSINRKCACQRHIDNHHPKTKDEGTCESCYQFFLFKKDLEMHIKGHYPDLYRHVCTVEGCIARFKRWSDLRNHLNSHNGIANFVCTQCPKAFVTKGALTYHTRTHTGENPFKCCFSCCTFKSAQISGAKTHAKNVHGLSKEEIEKKHKSFYTLGALEKIKKSRFKQ